MTNSLFIGEPLGPIFPSEAPIFGYKVVTMRWNSGDPVIVPPHYYMNEKKLSAESHCRKKHPTNDSFQKCSCGFYSYHTAGEATRHLRNFGYGSNCFVVQVALSGTVIEAENGMKSTRQRVRQLIVPPCWNCNKLASVFVEHEEGYLVSACDECSAALKRISFDEFQKKTQQEGFNPISVLPVPTMSAPEVNQVLNNVDAKELVAKGLRELLAAGDISGLITVKLQLDELIQSLPE